MIRTTAVPTHRSLRTAAAAASVLGIVALAGCSTTAGSDEGEAGTTPAATPAASSAPEATGSTGSATTGAYADGTYTEDGTYVDGGGVSETISVTITLADDIVTAVEVSGDAASPQSRQYQEAFIGGVSDEVVGKEIDSLSVSRVAGSSLTSGGFNDALEKIKADAAA